MIAFSSINKLYLAFVVCLLVMFDVLVKFSFMKCRYLIYNTSMIYIVYVFLLCGVIGNLHTAGT